MSDDHTTMDPWDGGTGTSIAILITQMRIYDVLLSLLTEDNHAAGVRVYNAHKAGKIIGPLPSLDIDEQEETDT